VVLGGVDRTYDLVECPACRSRFFNPLPSADDLSRFYVPGYYGSDWYKQEGKGREFGRAMLPRGFKGRLLDIGCGLGFFINGIRQSSGWEVYGVEFSPEAVAFARAKLNLQVVEATTGTMSFPDGFFDFVHVNNVLEHVRNPLALVQECRRLLRAGGNFYLSVPNGPVDSANLLQYHQCEMEAPSSKDGHIFFLSPTALQLLFQESDFEIVSSRTYGLRRGLRALGYLPPKPGWKKPYQPGPTKQPQSAIKLASAKRRLPGYYAYRFWQSRIKMLPGLWKFGLDFEFILRARQVKS
jgi:SAM-dependent methyltransferase